MYMKSSSMTHIILFLLILCGKSALWHTYQVITSVQDCGGGKNFDMILDFLLVCGLVISRRMTLMYAFNVEVWKHLEWAQNNSVWRTGVYLLRFYIQSITRFTDIEAYNMFNMCVDHKTLKLFLSKKTVN